MEFRQVKFRCPNADTIESKKPALGGIAVYERELDKDPQYIICGCCGGRFKPNEVEILRKYEWIPISEAIMGE